MKLKLRIVRIRLVLLLHAMWMLAVITLHAQDATLFFNTSTTGTTNSIGTWGVDAFSGAANIVQSGLIYMGTNAIGVVELPFSMKDPLTNGQLSGSVQSELAGEIASANLAGTNALWMFNSGTGDGVNSYFITGANRIDTNKWAQCIIAHQLYCNRPIQWVSPFNEPDYSPWNQGSQSDLFGVMGLLKGSTNFATSLMAGGTTLDVDGAVSWYDSVKAPAGAGTTHTLAGSYSSYLNWLSDVNTSGGFALNPEVHNLSEVIAGAQYGLKGAIWWETCTLTRGLFVNDSSRGTRLAYAEVPNNWSTAAVYRPTNNYTALGFVGSNERQGVATTYQFTCLDRDVWFNGSGPARSFTNTVGTAGENYVTISWGPDIPPSINGMYVIVNHNSSKVMEVANASLANGAAVDQNSYNSGSNQWWTITPIGGGYYTFVNANSGQYADMLNFSTANGGLVEQYPGGGNFAEQWYFQYLSNGWFNIRQANSGLYLEVPGNTMNNGVQLDQSSYTGGLNQQWHLVPVGNYPFNLTPPASPSGLTASAGKVSVTLHWTPNTEADFASYTVFRSTNSGGPYDTIAQGITANTFLDKSASQPRPYYYVIKAVDDSQNQSSYSAEASATPSGGTALVAKYPFDGNSLDSSGNRNNAVVTGNATYVAGKVGSAINLDGASSYLSLPAGMLNFSNFTIAAWVNWNGGNQWQRIFDFGNGTGQYMFLTPNSGSGTLRFAVTTNGNGAEQRLDASELPTSQWVHVAVTYNGAVGNLYTNGVLAASNTGMNIPPASFNPALNFLGKSQFSADPLFGGKLDEVLVANYALSPAQVALLVTNHPPQFTNSTLVSPAATGGQFYSSTIAGSATNSDAGDSLSYAEVSGPSWLTISANGAISGTPGLTAAGTNNFLVNVFDTGGLSSSATLVVYVAGVADPIVTLAISDSIGTSSFNSAGNWDSGAAPRIPSDYFTAGNTLRTPTGTNDYVFAGNSLTLQPNAQSSSSLLFAGTGTRTYTITNLIGSGGSLGSGSTGADTCVLGGNLSLQPGTTNTIQAGQSPFVINASINGSGNLATASTLTTTLAGSNSYTGGTMVTSGTLKVDAGPVVYLSFDNTNGTIVVNDGSGGSAMNGVRIGAATIVGGGRYGNALSINGTSGSYVLIPNKVTSLDCTTTGAAWTYALWLKTTTVGAKFGYQGNGAWNSTAQTSFYLNDNNANFNGGKVGGVRFGDNWLTGETSVNDNTWHFVAITVSGGIKTVYVDGNIDQQTGTTGWAAAGSSGASQFWIGSSPDTGDASTNLNGLIDEVYIYNRALGQAEIQKLMTVTNAVAASLSGCLSPASSMTVASGATLDLNGSTQSIASLSGGGIVTNTGGHAATLIITNSTGSGTFSGSIGDIASTSPLSLVQNGGLTTTLSGVNTYRGDTTINGGTLTVNGVFGAGSVSVANTGTLGGDGLIGGALTVQSGGTLMPGGGLTTLTVNNNVTLQLGSTTLLEISGTAQTNDQLVVSGALNCGGALIITNLSGTLAGSDAFQLFRASAINGVFTSISLPGLSSGLAWDTSNLASGFISIVQTTPTNLTWAMTNGTNLALSWPAGYTGWRLQVQTNNLASTNWIDVPGSALTNSVLLPLDPTVESLFYRLIYP